MKTDTNFESVDPAQLATISGGFDFGSLMQTGMSIFQAYKQGGWQGALQTGLGAIGNMFGSGGGGGGGAAGG